MSKVQISIAQVLQGDFQIKSLNLLLAFQVNCPGCFVYALPLAETLHQKYANCLNVLGLSTAFEDFDLNTADYTQRLLDTGEIIGATKLYFQHHGQQSYSYPICFPVAFDQIGTASEVIDDNDIEHICHLTPTFTQMPPDTQARMRTRIQQGLKNHSLIAYTFTVNQLQGTPSWILFDGNSNILAQWFGHKPETEVDAIISNALKAAAMTPVSP